MGAWETCAPPVLRMTGEIRQSVGWVQFYKELIVPFVVVNLFFFSFALHLVNLVLLSIYLSSSLPFSLLYSGSIKSTPPPLPLTTTSLSPFESFSFLFFFISFCFIYLLLFCLTYRSFHFSRLKNQYERSCSSNPLIFYTELKQKSITICGSPP